MARSWNNKSLRIDSDFNVYEKIAASQSSDDSCDSPLVVFVHGAGYTGLTWSFLVSELLKLRPGLSVVSFDLPLHGKSQYQGQDAFSIEFLAQSTASLISHYQSQAGGAELLLVGHSLGGSIVAKVVRDGLVKGVIGVVLLDIVEEAAIAALAHMPAVLASRPKRFDSEEAIIEWGLSSRTYRSIEAAQVSLLSQYKQDADGKFSIIARLEDSQPYWERWFQGLSNSFLAIPCSKMLVLAEQDYLDKTLLIGQMQGKFQLEIIQQSGHAIQEDQPKKLAQLLEAFIKRNIQLQELNKPTK